MGGNLWLGSLVERLRRLQMNLSYLLVFCYVYMCRQGGFSILQLQIITSKSIFTTPKKHH